MSVKKKTKKLKTESVPSSPTSDLTDRSQIFNPIEYKNGSHNYQSLYDNDEDYPFIKLLEAINMRAIDLPMQAQYPKMDLSALYCLGITIQEYARHLSTNILTQKRSSQCLPSINTLFSAEELESKKLYNVIEKYKSKVKRRPIQPVPTVAARPNIEQEMSKQIRQKKSHMDHNLRIKQDEETYHEKILRKPEWQSLLKKIRDPEAAARKANILRTEHSARQATAAVLKKRKLEEEEKQEALIVNLQDHKQQQHIPKIKQERFLPFTTPGDIFDMASSSSQQKKKKPSSSSSNKKKRKKSTRSGGF